MLHFRPFRNTNPPALAAFWRGRIGERGFLQPVSVDVFEQYVFAKTYFDPRGLILAWDDDRLVGFAHAGFGPNPDGSRLDHKTGVVCVLAVRADALAAPATNSPAAAADAATVADGLLDRCEAYLKARGAAVLFGGASAPNVPFYFGLYGGCEPVGVPATDAVAADVYARRGYQPAMRTVLLRCRLEGFRAVVDRRQAELRRRMFVHTIVDPPSHSWWEACVGGDFDRTRFEVSARGHSESLARVTFRAMDLTEPGLPGRVGGVLDLFVDSAQRRQGLATFLLGEAFRALGEQGVSVVEVAATADNAPAMALLEKLQFAPVAEGIVYRKSLG